MGRKKQYGKRAVTEMPGKDDRSFSGWCDIILKRRDPVDEARLAIIRTLKEMIAAHETTLAKVKAKYDAGENWYVEMRTVEELISGLKANLRYFENPAYEAYRRDLEDPDTHRPPLPKVDQAAWERVNRRRR